MIRHIIFDMGGVLLNWQPTAVARAFVDNDADARVLAAALFETPDWQKTDSGELDDAGIKAIALKNAPERLHGPMAALCDRYHEALNPLDGAVDFLARVAEAGLDAYLLSNTCERFPAALPDAVRARLSGFVISAAERAVKPDARIYEILLDRYGLKAEECFFFDDAPANIDGARAVGIDGMVFTGDYGAAAEALRARGVDF